MTGRDANQEGFELATALGPLLAPARTLASSLDAADAAAFVADKALELVFPDRREDPMFRDAISRSAFDNVDAMWRIIAGRASLHAATTPQGAFTFAETAARVGVPIGQLERVYRVGTALVWLCWYREARAYAERTGTSLHDLIEAPTLVIHSYLDALLSPTLERYDATRAESRRTREHLQRSILRQALDGLAVLDRQDVANALGVTVDDEHLAFVVRCEHLDHSDVVDPARRAAGANNAAAYRHGPDSWIVWLSRRDEFGSERLRALRRALERTGATIAMGEVSAGVEGLGTTGRDALEAARLQALLGDGRRVLTYADVRLEALLLNSPEKARRFVHAELRGLGDDSPRTQRLRETAMLWLSTGSHVATAATLGLHEHTVRNRIAHAEELVGRGLATRRTEMLVALRLLRMLEMSGAPDPRL